MALNTKMQPLKQTLSEFHVYDHSLKTLGPIPIVNKGEHRVVLLTREQAAHFIELGAIGRKPFHELSDAGKKLLHQFSGGRITKSHEEAAKKREAAKAMTDAQAQNNPEPESSMTREPAAKPIPPVTVGAPPLKR